MISHRFRCIFIHIPRVGGSGVEKAICGKNWWSIDSKTKHILASQARTLYADYWDKYFKFAFVRNPWTRAVSLLQFSDIYYGHRENMLTPEHIQWYRWKFGYPRTIEFDYRFYTREEVERDIHIDNSVYGNFLDEELDFVGRFENLEDDFAHIARTIGVENVQLPHIALSKKKGNIEDYYDDNLIEMVGDIYRMDCAKYGYGFPKGSQ